MQYCITKFQQEKTINKMSKKVLSVALLVVLATMAVSCQKERYHW